MGDKKNLKILVTGGGGFVGKALVQRLVGEGHMVTSISRQYYSELEELGAHQVVADISNRQAVFGAVKNHEVIFHVAAKAGYWGKYGEYYETNVLGTRNLLEAAHKNGIEQFIYTSSASVVFSGKSIINGHPGLPYPKKAINAYTSTKALAEKLVLRNYKHSFKAVSLRPHIIWGPGDQHLLPRLIKRAQSGRLRIIGDGKNIVDTVYIDNLIDAHLLALEALRKSPEINGKAYYVTNGEPVNLWFFINQILEKAGLDPVSKKTPANTAFVVCKILNLSRIILPRSKEPALTPFVVKELSQSHWFDISQTKKELGYEPKISLIQGLNKLFDHESSSGLLR